MTTRSNNGLIARMEGVVRSCRLLSDAEAIATAFRAGVGMARSIDVAVAWTAPCDELRALCRFAKAGGALRVLVGRDFNGTDPRALKTLLQASPSGLRWGWRSPTGIYHPKMYVFRSDDRVIAIIGSANLTRGGFLFNVETAVEIDGLPDLLADVTTLFEGRWGAGDEVDAQAIASYADRWEQRRAESPQEPASSGEDDGGEDLVEAGQKADEAANRVLSWDWDEYVAGLRWVNRLWEPFYHHTIDSYLDMLEEVPALTALPIRELSREARRALLGLRQPDYPHAGWLGSMRAAGEVKGRFFSEDAGSVAFQREVTRALRILPPGESPLRIETVRGAYDALRALDGVGTAVATRLLTLRRPDALISVNTASQVGLSRIFDIPVSRLVTWQGYEQALKKLWRSKWMAASTPSDPFERKVWPYRAALLDAFVYRPESGEHPDEDVD